MKAVMLLLFALVVIGILLTTLQTFLTWRFRSRRILRGATLGMTAVESTPLVLDPCCVVSIIKPVCGLDDELEQNLESFTRIRGVSHEIILSVADGHDPALAVIERVRARHPLAPFRVVIGGDDELERGNRKVARLIAAAPHATGRILFISDSNVRIEPDDLAGTIVAFDDSRVGCVSNLFTGAGAQTFGASIEALHLLSFVATGSVLAATAKVPCVVGKSMAISREALEAVGGFARFARVLAEDQAIGLAVKEAGYDVVLSPVVVRNIIVRRTLRRALDRQIRWNKIRYAFSKGTYASELLVNPLPFAVLAAMIGPLAILPLTIILRIAQVAILAAATDAPLTARELLMVPLLDLLQFGAQFVPFLDDTVTWRGCRLRVGPNTVLMETA
jgi:ceramide glucosyltransferase